jgi:hypothetical protein
VFVATSIALTPDDITVANDGEPLTVYVTVPDNTAWNVGIVDLSVEAGLLQVSPTDGVGPGTLELALPPNNTSYDREYWVNVGSEYVTVRQPAAPSVFFVDPSTGPLTGGTEVSIYGTGFVDGASVFFGGQPAPYVVVENNGAIRAVTPAHGATEGVDVVVMNPSGARGVLPGAFWYFDSTPPVITLTITGTLGFDGWYTSDVSAQWSVHDHESPIQYQDCAGLSVTHDTHEVQLTCTALSEGGTSSETLTLKRDSTVPVVSMSSPQERIYKRGEPAVASFWCRDETSGIASCVGTTANGAPLDTTTPGSFVFTVTATDRAGLRSVHTVKYVVKETPTLGWPSPAAVTYGTALNVAQLNATANVPGTFTYIPAAGTVLDVGTHTLSVTFTPADPGTYFTASATAVLVVTPAPLTIVANNAMKVYGQALPSFTATATEFVNGDSFASLAGSLTFATPATATSAPGSYPLAASGLSSPNYAIQFATGALVVTKASTSMLLSMAPNPSRPRQEFQVRAEIGVVAPGAGMPTGTVAFQADGELLGTAPVINGVATLEDRFKRGSYVVTATYSGDGNFASAAASTIYSTK